MILFTDKEINDILSGIEKKYRKEKAKRSAGSFPSHAIFALSEVKKRINKLDFRFGCLLIMLGILI